MYRSCLTSVLFNENGEIGSTIHLDRSGKILGEFICDGSINSPYIACDVLRIPCLWLAHGAKPPERSFLEHEDGTSFLRCVSEFLI